MAVVPVSVPVVMVAAAIVAVVVTIAAVMVATVMVAAVAIMGARVEAFHRIGPVMARIELIGMDAAGQN